jgi:fluoride ion exporter CrcB/FEX
MMTHYFWIGLGGAFGAIARAILGSLLPAQLAGIPLQTPFQLIKFPSRMCG